ncbi:hypothetical protein GOP47_0028544 [Adiantum capillus-veneris]|nr:hypothetical protein GOP47_0028544 [Adiantum capillus-veneris]
MESIDITNGREEVGSGVGAALLLALLYGLLPLGSSAVLIVILRRWRITAAAGQEKRRFPPGPFAWPVIGHLHLLVHAPDQVIRDLSRRYGHILGLRLGKQLCVVISSPQLAKEVLQTHDKIFADRPPFQFNEHLLYGQNTDIVFSSQCPEWRQKRKICTVGLFTPKRMQDLEHVRREEVGALLRRLQDLSEGATQPVHIGWCVGEMAARVVMRLLQSEGSAQAGAENLVQLAREWERDIASPTLGDVIPALSWLPFPRLRRMRRLRERFDAALSLLIAQRKQQSATASSYDDLLQSILAKEVDPTTKMKASSSPQDTLTPEDIKCIMLDMLAAGINTTSLTLEWAMAELLKNPHCMQRLKKEIEEMMDGNVRQITDVDIMKLSYLKCVVKEILRLHPVVPFLIPHFSTEECKIEGYTIPARTIIFVDVWAIGRDEGLWANAEEFRPERFEDKEVDVKGQHFELLPFGSGRRICVGMPLALSIIQVTLANLVNHFNWDLPFGQTASSMDMKEKNGMIITNKATPMMVIPRPRFSY